MTIRVDENLLGIWYVAFDDNLDVMMGLMREGEGYKVEGRTRTYLGDINDPWDEKDRKRWFGGGVQAKDDTEAIAKTRDNMVQMSFEFVKTFKPEEPPAIFELVRGEKSVEEFGNVLRSMPWAHSKAETTH